MIFNGVEAEIDEVLDLDDGSKIVLYEMLTKEAIAAFPDEVAARNIYRLDSHGKVLWRVSSKFDHNGGPFKYIEVVDGVLEASRWDSGGYSIDLETGFATPIRFEK